MGAPAGSLSDTTACVGGATVPKPSRNECRDEGFSGITPQADSVNLSGTEESKNAKLSEERSAAW